MRPTLHIETVATTLVNRVATHGNRSAHEALPRNILDRAASSIMAGAQHEGTPAGMIPHNATLGRDRCEPMHTVERAVRARADS